MKYKGKSMRFIIYCWLLISVASVTAGDLEEMYKSPKTKSMTADEFMKNYPNFKWQGVNKRVAISKKSLLFNHKIREAIVYFSAQGKLTRMDAWIYNRGDDGNMAKKQFETKYEALLDELTKYFEVRKPKKSGIDGVTRSTAYAFQMANRHEVKLLVGFDKKPYRADFLNLVIRNYEDKDRITSRVATGFISKSDNGDVFIDKIPMIDQGPKGYCVPATLARIGQHFGVDVSMHEIAMLADSSSGGGTSSRQAMEALKDKYARMRLNIKEIKFKYPFNVYNIKSPKQAEGHLGSLKENDRNVKKFFGLVKKQVDKGYIVAWTMIVGLLPENGKPARQGGGGHMRMIMGYNEKTNELIFSDSWGNGHEIKRIDAASAMLVSSGIYEIRPASR